MLTRVEIGFVQGLQRYYVETSSKKSITTIILPGKSGILVETNGLSEKELRQLSLVKKDLSEALWETFQSSWKASNPLNLQHSYTQQYMEQVVRWEECKQRVKEIAVVISPEQEWLNKMNTMHGLKPKASKLEGVTLTNLPMPTSVLNKFSRHMLLQSK